MPLLACAACGRTTEHELCFTVNSCKIWRCEACGLGSAETSGFDPGAYYTADYFCGKHGDGYADYRGAEPVLRREFARSVDFVRRFRPTGRLLDIGCAYGFFLKEAQSHFDVVGIELAEDAAESSRRAGLHVLSGVADEGTMARIGQVDVITMFDVIEHLLAPSETLALCCRYLRPGGVVVITTGDFGSLAARWAGRKWRLMTPPQHLWFFTRESMRRMAMAQALAMDHFDHPAKIVPLSLIVFQLRRMVGMRGAPAAAASGIGVPVNLFDAMRVVLRKGEKDLP
jgi:2-polyprenyl-3-methyl-5-hydroxy-6-metoxy-1,4-benzoquinol methylase